MVAKITRDWCLSRAQCAGPAPGSAIDKKKGKAKSPATGKASNPAGKHRSAVAWGKVKSPGGTEHVYQVNSGITPPGCSEAGKAVLRNPQAHSDKPGGSLARPAAVSDSPIRMPASGREGCE